METLFSQPHPYQNGRLITCFSPYYYAFYIRLANDVTLFNLKQWHFDELDVTYLRTPYMCT